MSAKSILTSRPYLRFSMFNAGHHAGCVEDIVYAAWPVLLHGFSLVSLARSILRVDAFVLVRVVLDLEVVAAVGEVSCYCEASFKAFHRVFNAFKLRKCKRRRGLPPSFLMLLKERRKPCRQRYATRELDYQPNLIFGFQSRNEEFPSNLTELKARINFLLYPSSTHQCPP